MAEQRRVVVTGGAGFLGSHITEALVAEGFHVAVVDSFTDDYDPAVKHANIEELRRAGCMPASIEVVDLRNAVATTGALARLRPDVVVHCAAVAGVRASVADPASYVHRNITATMHLLQAMREVGCRRLLFASSSSVYGDAPAPFREDRGPLVPASPYGVSKLSAELFLQNAAQLYGLSYVALRFFTVYGPRQRPDMAIHRFASALLRDAPIAMHGDGRSWRDYTHVDDVVRGVIAAVHRIEGPAAVHDTINIGSATPVLLRDVVAMLEDACGESARVRHRPEQSGDVGGTLADITKAERLLGYQPRRTFVDGLGEFVAWLQERSAVGATTDVLATT